MNARDELQAYAARGGAMISLSFIDRDGDELNALGPNGDGLMEINLNGGGQYISFYAADAPALIKIIQQAAGIETVEPTP